MSTWESTLHIVSSLRHSPLLISVVLDDLESEISDLRNKRESGELTKSQEEKLRVSLLKRYILSKRLNLL